MEKKSIAEKYIGMEKRRAQNEAEADNLIFRLIMADGEEFLPFPKEDERRTDRICVEIERNKVVKATIA